MLWVGSDNSKDWVYKRKGTVLRLFNKIKLEMWEQHIEECPAQDPNYTPISDAEYAAMSCEAY